MSIQAIPITKFQPWEELVSEEELDKKAGKALRDRRHISAQLAALKLEANSICEQIQKGAQVLEGRASAKIDNGLSVKPNNSGIYEPCGWPTAHDIAELSEKRQELERRLERANSALEEMGFGSLR